MTTYKLMKMNKYKIVWGASTAVSDEVKGISEEDEVVTSIVLEKYVSNIWVVGNSWESKEEPAVNFNKKIMSDYHRLDTHRTLYPRIDVFGITASKFLPNRQRKGLRRRRLLGFRHAPPR